MILAILNVLVSGGWSLRSRAFFMSLRENSPPRPFLLAVVLLIAHRTQKYLYLSFLIERFFLFTTFFGRPYRSRIYGAANLVVSVMCLIRWITSERVLAAAWTDMPNPSHPRTASPRLD